MASLGKLMKAFLHSLPKFCHIWWFVNTEYVRPAEVDKKLWKIIKYGKTLAKNEVKPCSTCISTHFSADFGYPKNGFRVPTHSTTNILLHFTDFGKNLVVENKNRKISSFLMYHGKFLKYFGLWCCPLSIVLFSKLCPLPTYFKRWKLTYPSWI